MSLLHLTERGLYCAAGDFFIDPWLPVPRAVITHGHGDHARPGSAHYLAAAPGLGVLRVRLGPDADVATLAWHEAVEHQGVKVSLHPAGHILGSAQVRVELRRQHAQLRTTTVYVTHDQVEAMTLADRIVVLNGGLVQQVGTPSELFFEPAPSHPLLLQLAAEPLGLGQRLRKTDVAACHGRAPSERAEIT